VIKINSFISVFTPDLKNRIKARDGGFVKATQNRRPISLIYYKAYLEESDARRREKYLKGGNGRKDLKIQLLDCFKKLKYKFA
jgi:putative endonuclease